MVVHSSVLRAPGRRIALILALACLAPTGSASAQEPPTAATLCGQAVPPPAQLPANGSDPVLYALGLCFSAQGNTSSVEAETYLYYIQLRPSRPSQATWIPFDDEARATIRADFRRLWATGFLDDLRIEATDYVFPNGVVGKVVTYHMEERERLKLVQYEGSDQLDRTKIDEALVEAGISLRLDSLVDQAAIARTKGVVRRLLAEKGFTNSEVRHTLTPLSGGPKLVNLTFHVNSGPKTAIRDVEFLGNDAIGDGPLAAAMKDTKAESLLSFVGGGGKYNAATFGEDALRVEDYYRSRGFARASVGEPELRLLDTSADQRTQWVQLRVPVSEGPRYQVGTVTFEGNTILRAEALRALFRVREGEWYDQSKLREGLERAREAYGAGGYMEFTGIPDLQPRPGDTPPVMDVTIRINEGEQYLVNRITFSGNTVTRDHVIRRELQLVEGGIFNNESLKYSVRRLNQLGYFTPLEGNENDLVVEKTPGLERAVDITLKLKEQNRNQMQFGAGVSQYEGLFGNVSFTTSNFLGRGESLTVTGQKGSRSSTYDVGFTKPYIWSRPVSAGVNLFTRRVDYLSGGGAVAYSEARSGVSLTGGYSLFSFSRLFVTYGYEVIDTAVSSDLLNSLDESSSVGVPVFNPYLDEGRHVESRIGPTFVHNTVDNPFAPRRGVKLTLSAPLSGGFLGGTTNYVKPEFEGILYIPHLARTALGIRVHSGLVQRFGSTHTLPYYVRYFLGGENQIRGVNIRTVGPTDGQNRAIGGDKFALFNAEYYFDIAGPVRALVFHDAGQAFAEDQAFDLTRLRTSSGVELRVMVPVLNVPFRLIYAWNIYRDEFQPARTFKFAVGTTF